MSCRSSIFIALFILVLGLAGTTEVAAGVSLTLHWDRETGTSMAVVTNTVGDPLAAFPWDGPLPRSYGAGDDEIDQPVFTLGQLRDLLLESADPEAEDALALIRELMGAYADTGVGALPESLGTGIGYADYEITEWCGIDVTAQGRCVQDDSPGISSIFCRGYTCKGTRISPSP